MVRVLLASPMLLGFLVPFVVSGDDVTALGQAALDIANSLVQNLVALLPAFIPIIVVGFILGFVVRYLGRR